MAGWHQTCLGASICTTLPHFKVPHRGDATESHWHAHTIGFLSSRRFWGCVAHVNLMGKLSLGELPWQMPSFPCGHTKTHPNNTPPTLACRSRPALDARLISQDEILTRPEILCHTGVWEPPNSRGDAHGWGPSCWLSDLRHETRWGATLCMWEAALKVLA